MPRYDLMHWSQRVRDQQAAHALNNSQSVAIKPIPAAPQTSAKPRLARPKPPKDPDADNLLRLCREGRLFELQAWVAAGKPLTVPSHYRQTPLRVALDTGFHSLIEFLLQHEHSQAAKDEALHRASWTGQRAAMQLGLQFGASVGAVPFQDVIETWDRATVELFVQHGADLVHGVPLARAFKQRVKAVLGIFLHCRRARPDLADALQQQADMALRQACQDEDLKWVSLLMWLGANPRAKGLATDDYDDPDFQSDSSYHQSAFQIACAGKKLEILRRLKPDPAADDLGELMAAAGSFITTPETLSYLVNLGANVNDKTDGGSTALDACLRYFGWRESVLDAPHVDRRARVPTSRLGGSLNALRFVLKSGARWTPDERAIGDVRRALYRVDDQAISTVVELLRAYGACEELVLSVLVGTPKMRRVLAAIAREQNGRQPRREADVRKGRAV